MTIYDSIAMLFFCVAFFILGLLFGINVGIVRSAAFGPVKACETYKLSILDCSKLATDPSTPPPPKPRG